ncbi:unnamed protein product [Candida verbasci]|uniref:Small ribosomal subunit protein mS29 n=1 Tax=Candida verbasci TaxID=1227364 RepID=A0A9W4XCN5_9ASCO|nr:unnamed protein product [Candida verbasci]
MLRFTVRSINIINIPIRCLSSTNIVSAPFKQKEGKTKQKMVTKKNDKVDVKRSTNLTHLPFGEAVRNLQFEKTASELKIDELTSDFSRGKVFIYPKKIESKLKSMGGFKKFQFQESFAKPITLTTSNTTRINELFVNKLDEKFENNRLYIDGSKGIGKSTLLNQAIALSLLKHNHDIIVLHMDNAEVIGNGSSNYIFNNKLSIYQQPMITRRWIKKILAANEDTFKKMKLTQDVKFTKDKLEIKLTANKHTLYDYLSQNFEFGKTDPHTHFKYLINEIKQHSKNIPVLVSIDNFNAVTDFSLTQYKSPDFNPIHIQEFEMGKFLIDVANGSIGFEKGGVLLSKCNDFAPNRKTIEVAVYPEREYNLYMKQPEFDLELARKLQGIKPFEMTSLTIDESRELMKIWKDQGVLIVRKDFNKKDFNQESSQVVEVDMESQFEKIVLNSFNTSQGNPMGMFKQIALTY